MAELTAQKHPVPLRILGFPDRFGESGGYDEVLAAMGLSVPRIVAEAQELVARKA